MKRECAYGSVIHSNEWPACREVFSRMPWLNATGYQHSTVRHQQHYVDPPTGGYTQAIQRAWLEAKSMIYIGENVRCLFLLFFLWCSCRPHAIVLTGGRSRSIVWQTSRYSSTVLSQSFLFGHIKSYFLKKKVILSVFLVIKMALVIRIADIWMQ